MTPSVTNPLPLWTVRWARSNCLDFRYFPKTDSSHLQAKKAAFKIKENRFQLFIAASQRAGRGRNRKIWLDSDFMTTWLWQRVKPFRHSPSVADFASDLLSAMISCRPHLPVKLKKTNDILLKDKKCAGLLLEIIKQGRYQALLLGVGINVFSHPEGVNAGHLSEYSSPLAEKEWQNLLNRLYSDWNRRVQSLSIPSI